MEIEFNDDAIGKAFDDSLANGEPEHEPEAEAVEDVEASAEEVEEVAEESPDDEPVEQPLEAPARWSAEDKERFAELPREAQEIVLKREADVNKHLTQKTQELAQTSKTYSQLEEILAPRREAFRMDGMNDAQAVEQLFTISDFASRDPAAFIRWFAQQRGIDLGTRNEEPADQPADALSQKVQQLEMYIARQEQARQQAEQQTYASQVEQFAAQMDESGQPAYPHFDAVRTHMAALVRSGAASTLADAYDQAVYANPETRKAVLEAQSKADEAKRDAERKAKAAKAAKAAGTQVRTPNGQFAPAARSMDDTLSAVYDRMAAS